MVEMVAARAEQLTRGWLFHRGDLPGPPSSCVDVSSWRPVDVPHDWAIEDLPARDADTAAPVLVVRNGTWRFRMGDRAEWARADLDDAAWREVTVPSDWSSYHHGRRPRHGWFRRRFVPTAAQLSASAAGSLRLGLGTIGSADQTFVNGVLVGSTGNFGPEPADAATRFEQQAAGGDA